MLSRKTNDWNDAVTTWKGDAFTDARGAAALRSDSEMFHTNNILFS